MKTKKYLSAICALLVACNFDAQDKTSGYVLMDQIEDEALYNSLPKVDTVKLPFRPNVYDVREVNSKSFSVVILSTPTPEFQGNQGSCTAWATSYAAGSILAYPKFNYNWDDAKRSPAYLFNQYWSSKGKNVYTMAYHQHYEGVCSLTQMPYNANDSTTLPNSTQRFDAYLNRTDFYTVSSSNLSSVNTYKQILSNGYPIVITIEVTDAFYTMWNGTGIWSTQGTGIGKYHALCIVGYDDYVQRFKVQNSWGTSGGDGGYLWISYNLVLNGVIRNAYVLTNITQDTYPTISGSSQLCSSEQYTVGAIPSGMSVTWGIVESPHPGLSFQASGNTATFTRGTNIHGVPYSGSYTIKAEVSNGTALYTATKPIVMPQTVTPSIDYQNHSMFPIWMKNQTRTLEAFDTNNVPTGLLRWTVQMPQSSTVNYYTGKTISLTPTSTGTLTVTLTNLAGCSPDNSCTKTYFITGTFGLQLQQGNENTIISRVVYTEDDEDNLKGETLYGGDYLLEVRNEQMQLVYSEFRDNPVTEISKSVLSPGLYSVRLIISGELIDTKALLIK